jgi:hypothetical protein
MGIRESLKDKSSLLKLTGLILLVGAVVYGLRKAMSSDHAPKTLAYFTTDDGATQFVDSMDHFPPFAHGGKTAYRVWMYSTDGGKSMFPVYLERYTPEGLRKMSAAYADYKAGKTHTPPGPSPADTEIKKPGAGNPWVSRADLNQVQKIIHFDVPSGSDVQVELPD